MFLKQISMTGFKSFADRVNLAFGPGVTCVVGPNGCGKSNVVDAFKWVLGEQSAKSLRGRQMQDMIFNGSSTRRSSNIAQVDLVFDNTDRALPLDCNEVTIGRKLYRSGESEYQLNKETVRRKDVRDLFMDTGVGTEAYSVIEQGRVEMLLQSSPVDRRTIFEEAAGISKYKARRREAQRKLERTRQNLLRVADIVDEVEKRLRSVKLAAGKARNFQQYDLRLRELQSGKSMAEYHRLTTSINEQTEQASQAQDQVAELNARINRHESEESHLTVAADRLAEQISAVDGDLVRTQSAVCGQEERIANEAKRIDEQQVILEQTAQRHRLDTDRLDSVRSDLVDAERSVTDLQEQAEALHLRVDGELAEDQSLARDLTRAQAVLEDEKSGIVDLLRHTAQAHNEIISLNTHRESLLDQKGKLSARSEQIASELQTYVGNKTELSRRLREVETLVTAEQERLEQKKTEATRIDHVRSELADHLAKSKEQRSAMLSRREVLLDLEAKMEGVGQGARSLLEARYLTGESPVPRENESETATGESPVPLGLVADFFDADVAHAGVIEAALGESDQYLVVEDSASFLADAGRFARLPGGVTVIGLDRLPPVINERDFCDRPGFVARALDLVRVPDGMEQLARHLLAKTVVVRSLEDALGLAVDDVYGHRFVTLDGQVVEPDGRVRLGPASSTAGLISRKSELRDLQGKLEQTDRRITSLDDQLNRTEAEASHILDVQQELRTSIYETQTAGVEARAGLQNIEESIRRLSAEQPLITGEVCMLERQMDDALEKRTDRRRALDDMERQNVEREARVGRIQQEIDKIVERRQACQERLTQFRVELGQVAEKRRTATERINALQEDAHQLHQAIARWTQDIDQCHARIAQAERATLNARGELHCLAMKFRRLDAAALQLRKRRELLRIDLESLGRSVKTARSELQQAETRLHEVQMSLAEMNVRRDDLVARTTEELGVDLAARFEGYQHQEQDWEAVEAEIAELRRKIERLGNVNLDAILELEELEQRHGFLTGQRDDLADSAKQIEQLIDRINAESAERFRTTFARVREDFRELFRKLFGGGKADIILEDPDDILESGIEIVAQPPGKELQSITLMSGGEKSMTAIAMMMSIFKSHPSPFAILDEVDAALDDVNNDRFNRIVQDFVLQSQFIVITHSRRTMGIADTLYGITMQEPGISTLVSVKLEQVGAA